MDDHPQPTPGPPSGPEKAPDRPQTPADATPDAQAAADFDVPPGFADLDEYCAWVQRLIDGDPGYPEDRPEFRGWADPEQGPPPEPDHLGCGISISLGDATDIDPGLLVAMTGRDGLGGWPAAPLFAQEAAADGLRPSPVLAALTEQALAGGLAGMTEDELIGVLRASVRLANREGWKQELLIGEYARRREQAKDAEIAATGRVSFRAGEFPGEELAVELAVSPLAAAAKIANAQELTRRLPATLASMADGLIDPYRASISAEGTCYLSDADAAAADRILAAFAPGRRASALARKAAALELKLAPDAVRARKEQAKRDRQRVEAGRERSGNASLAGREMDTADALASHAYICALAARLRAAGVDGSLDALRVRVFAELTQGRDPLDLIHRAPQTAQDSGTDEEQSGRDDPASDGPGNAAASGPGPHSSGDGPAGDSGRGDGGRGAWPAWGPGDPGYDELPDDDTPGAPRRDPAPLPALINLLIPAGTLLGWSDAPGRAAGWGLLDRQETTDIIRAAARHPRTRWCATLVRPDGTAVAHACADGRHPWLADVTGLPGSPGLLRPPESGTPATPATPGTLDSHGRDGPDPPRAERLADIIRRLGLTFIPVAKGGCDHGAAEDRYTPSRKLRHLVRARTERCDAPGCDAQAVNGDLDHTVEYPAGISCECNLGPKCRRHHRCKQAPGWKLEQTEPGVMRWTLPSGRVHTTTPTVYDL